MKKEVSTKLLIIYSSIIFGLIGLILLYLWKKEHTLSYIQSLYAINEIEKGILTGIIFSFFMMIIFFILIKLKKVYYPQTEGVIHLTEMLKEKRSNVILVALLPAITEEFFFRGVILGLLLTFTNPFIAVIITSILFVLVHISDQYKGQYYIYAYLFTMSVMTAISFILLESLWAAIIIHSLSNLITSILTRRGKIPIIAKS